jgi:DNA polymerase III epsilon subunit-like protein
VIVFDIETGALPLEDIQGVLPPFDPKSIERPGPFDPKSVKTGNLKDEAKINEKIEAARKAHTERCAKFQYELESAESKHWNDIESKGALNAVTGQVVAIGYRGKSETLHLAVDGVTERQLLSQFWKLYKEARKSSRPMVGFNIKTFDVPFITQRSWILGIEVPSSILTPTGYLDSTFVDLMDRWKTGVRGFGQAGFGTLNTVCKACGLSTKPSGCTGADFASMLFSDDSEQRAAAESYLRNDLSMTAELADRLGVS